MTPKCIFFLPAMDFGNFVWKEALDEARKVVTLGGDKDLVPDVKSQEQAGCDTDCDLPVAGDEYRQHGAKHEQAHLGGHFRAIH